MPATAEIQQVWRRLKAVYPDSTWFGGTHLEENKPRLTRMFEDVLHRFPRRDTTRIVDVGCYNGFLCYAFAQLGYRTAGIDAIHPSAVPERARLLAESDAPYFHANFNGPDPFAHVPREAFDLAILGEVIEHILFHPAGFLRAVGHLLRPDGLLILTTPNPHTLANAFRLLAGRSTCWGDHEFAHLPKLDPDGALISFEAIHYREYGLQALSNMIRAAGFEIERHQYLAMGVASRQPPWKRLLKAAPFWPALAAQRWFGMTHYVLARRTPTS